MNVAYNIDCMEYLKTLKDNEFELAVVDPPYGDGDGGNGKRFGGRFDRYDDVIRRGGGWAGVYGNGINDWDVAPSEEYFNELFRLYGGKLL